MCSCGRETQSTFPSGRAWLWWTVRFTTQLESPTSRVRTRVVTGITYKPGKDTRWYLRQAGGPTEMADRKATYVIRADGSIVGGRGSMFGSGVESAELRPGDIVVVPERIYSLSTKFKSTLSIAQIASSIGTAIAISAYYATH